MHTRLSSAFFSLLLICSGCSSPLDLWCVRWDGGEARERAHDTASYWEELYAIDVLKPSRAYANRPMSIDQHEDVGNVLVEITCDLACACELLQFISEGQSRAVPEINWMVRGRIMQLDDRLATIAWNLRSTAARCSGKDGPSETKQVLAAQTYRWLSELQQAHADVEAIFNLQSPEMNRVLNRATKVMISLKDALSVHDYSLRGMMKKQPPQDSPPPRRESPPEKKLQVRLASSR